MTFPFILTALLDRRPKPLPLRLLKTDVSIMKPDYPIFTTLEINQTHLAGSDTNPGEALPVSSALAVAKPVDNAPVSVAAGSEGGSDQHGAGGRSRVVPVVAESWEPDVSTAQVYTSHGNITRRRFDSEYLTKVLIG